MFIHSLHVSNFKSFDEFKVDFSNVNIIIGANASGKSNLINIFKFMKDIANFGLENALSMQGMEYIRNISLDNYKLRISIKWSDTINIVSRLLVQSSKRKSRSIVAIESNDLTYTFGIEIHKDNNGYTVLDDELLINGDIYDIEDGSASKGVLKFINNNGKIHVDINVSNPDYSHNKYEVFPFSRDELSINTLILESSLMPEIKSSIKKLSIYHIDPKLTMQAIPITGKVSLEETGSNIPIVLKSILLNDENKKYFYNIMTYLLPFINDIAIEKIIDKSLLLKIKEKHSNEFIPASMMSEGTISIISLIIMLYFQDSPVIIIEEPEKGIHPSLLSKVMTMIREASVKKQIFITTHNPSLVKNAGEDELILISRDSNGISCISKPLNNEEIKVFLDNEIGIDDLYIDNLLGI